MEWELQAVDRHGRRTGLIVEADEQTRIGQLREALVDVLDGAADGPLRIAGLPVDDNTPITQAGLATGTSVGIHPTGAQPTPPAREPAWELAVVGGLDAGRRVPLDAGAPLGLGRGIGSGLVLADPEVSRRHATVRVDHDGHAEISDLGSRNGTVRRGYRIDGAADLAPAEVVRVGESIVEVRPPAAPDARLERDPASGLVRYNRPPRILRPDRPQEIAMPAEPTPPHGFRFPIATLLVPLLAAGLCYAVLPGSTYYLVFLALSPLMAVANLVSDRRSGRKEYRTKLRAYTAELAAAHNRLAELARADERGSRSAHPDPAVVVRIATGPTGRMFERRRGDPDFLSWRIGLHDRPVRVRLTGPGASDHEPPQVHAVPAIVDLPAVGVLGVAGPRGTVLAMARSGIAQTTALHAPQDLGIVVLTGRDEATDWEWVSWLPHTLPHRPDLACRRMLATDRDQAETRVAELRRIVAERQAESSAALRDRAALGRHVVVVLDGARRLRDLPGLADLLIEGPAVGVYAVCLDTVEGNLPDECRATVVTTGPSGTRVRVAGPSRAPDDDTTYDDVLADGLSPALAEQMALGLAPVRVLGARFGDDDGLPEAVRFLELAGLSPNPTAEDVMARWAAQPHGHSTQAVLGVGTAGPVEIDLRRDGPHALVAGTSGAGKSELLQTLVAALALGNAPDALNVVLVDYKGGSAFAECRDLPHCIGMVTDLDGHLVNRALTALTAELRRREAILAEAGAKEIEDYWRLTGGRLPRLVIVVDEFASLVEEVPEFVTGVVDIGKRGRSLGIHVVLATQHPGGVVNADLRANVNLRLCLRVTDGSHSTDVIDVPDAVRISRHHPGRAYLRTGHRDLALLQAARIGWPRAATTPSDVDTIRVQPRPVTSLGMLPVSPSPTGAGDTESGETDLTVLVAAAKKAANRLGVAAPPSPWLPPLPDRITVAELEPVPAGFPVAVPLGLVDEPAQQAQSTYVLDLEQAAPIALAGMSRSGRSTLLRTLAATLADRSSPADVHLYAIDYGSHALAPLTALPHVGACVGGDEPDRVERLLALLTAEVSRRQRVLADGGYSSLREQRAALAAADRLPYLVLLVDQHETFLSRHQEIDGGRLVEELDGLLRRGPAVGILPVLATDRSGFGHRLAGTVATRLVLRQADPDQVATFGLAPKAMPRRMPPGRAIAVPAGVEVQAALLAPDPDGAAQAAAVHRLAGRLDQRWDGLDPDRLPHRVDPLPGSITITELAALRPTNGPVTPTTCTIGAGGDHLGPVDVDLADAGGVLLVSGPPRSGRSATLAALLWSLAGRDTGELPAVLLCPRPSPLRDLADLPGVAGVLDGTDPAEELEEILGELRGPAAVVVDDAELLVDTLVAGRLDRLAQTARDSGSVVIAAGTTDDLLVQRYRGWLATIRRARAGLLLNPGSYTDGEVFDARLPRSIAGGWPPGRGLLVWRGATVAVQVPMADAVSDARAGLANSGRR